MMRRNVVGIHAAAWWRVRAGRGIGTARAVRSAATAYRVSPSAMRVKISCTTGAVSGSGSCATNWRVCGSYSRM